MLNEARKTAQSSHFQPFNIPSRSQKKTAPGLAHRKRFGGTTGNRPNDHTHKDHFITCSLGSLYIFES